MDCMSSIVQNIPFAMLTIDFSTDDAIFMTLSSAETYRFYNDHSDAFKVMFGRTSSVGWEDMIGEAYPHPPPPQHTHMLLAQQTNRYS